MTVAFEHSLFDLDWADTETKLASKEKVKFITYFVYFIYFFCVYYIYVYFYIVSFKNDKIVSCRGSVRSRGI